MSVLVATDDAVLWLDATRGELAPAKGLGARSPACLAIHPRWPVRAWCGTDDGVMRSEDGGRSWSPRGLAGVDVTAIAASARTDRVWVGSEPSRVWTSGDDGASWFESTGLLDLPSARSWSFPPKPDTHHVRWIALDPRDADHAFVAIEAGALVSTKDGGRSWRDRVASGPFDTHELAIHPRAPDVLRSAAGDGYLESRDGGASWTRPREGLDVGYFRSVAVDPGDPEVVVATAATGPYSAYWPRPGADGRLYRRVGRGAWARVTSGWPARASTVAPIVRAGLASGELWAVDERGVHRSTDAGVSWRLAAPAPSSGMTPWDLAVGAAPDA